MEGLGFDAAGRWVRLKWHRAQRSLGDAPFTAARLKEGFRLGAAMEVDVRRCATGEFVCLHDDATLDRETTGEGPVAAVGACALRGLRMRGGEPILLLEDIAALAADSVPEAQLQLDLKERLAAIDDVVDGFGAALGDHAAKFCLGGHDWDAVKRLAAAAPSLRLGFDPCDRPEASELRHAQDYAAFVETALKIAPQASIFYIRQQILLGGLREGFDMIGAFHAQGREVDAWTLKIDQPDLARDLQMLAEAGIDQITTSEPVEIERLWRGL